MGRMRLSSSPKSWRQPWLQAKAVWPSRPLALKITHWGTRSMIRREEYKMIWQIRLILTNKSEQNMYPNIWLAYLTVPRHKTCLTNVCIQRYHREWLSLALVTIKALYPPKGAFKWASRTSLTHRWSTPNKARPNTQQSAPMATIDNRERIQAMASIGEDSMLVWISTGRLEETTKSSRCLLIQQTL